MSLVHGIVHLNLLLQRHNNHQDLYLYRVYDNNKHFFIYIFIVFAIKYFATDYMKDFQSEVSQLLIILGELLSVLRVRAVCVWCTLSARFTSIDIVVLPVDQILIAVFCMDPADNLPQMLGYNFTSYYLTCSGYNLATANQLIN